MKTKSFILVIASMFTTAFFAQDRTTVTATSNDISDNLDLRAVASIFGDSENLEDFERRLNDPKTQISNLDLNGDRQVDYLRVIESVEGRSHLIIIQSVLERDVFQDVATIEVERDSNNAVQVQVVGDSYMYGQNYIYEPIYVSRPMIYDYFWATSYSPYYSSYYWGYYPSYYYAWNPYPIYRYRNHIHNHINVHHHYNYVNVRRNTRHAALASNYRGNGYALRNPNRSFTQRNGNTVRNTYELQQIRNNEVQSHTSTPRNPAGVRSNPTTNGSAVTPTTSANVRSQINATGTNIGTRTVNSAGTSNNVRSNVSATGETPPIVNTPRAQNQASSRSDNSATSTGTRAQMAPRSEAQSAPASSPAPRPNVKSRKEYAPQSTRANTAPAARRDVPKGNALNRSRR